MKAGNFLNGITEHGEEYDKLIANEDGEGLEEYNAKNTFII
jgi:hypothetical protein